MLTRDRRLAGMVTQKLEDIRRLCIEANVGVLEVFGSAATDDLTSGSDLDFLVEFLPMEPGQHADAYFKLLFGLEDLFARTIDLSETKALRNPYFIDGIKDTRQVVYAS